MKNDKRFKLSGFFRFLFFGIQETENDIQTRFFFKQRHLDNSFGWAPACPMALKGQVPIQMAQV